MQGKRHFMALDGLRGIAAISVALGHLKNVFGLHIGYGNTALAVDFFFMLSGFVLAYAYSARLSGGMAFADFIISRVIRLYPLIVFATILAVLPIAANYLLVPNGAISGTYVARLTIQASILWPELTSNLLERSFLPLNPPSWSLFFEMVASVLFGLGLWRGRLASCLITWAISLLGVLLVARTGSFDVGYEYHNGYYGFFRVAFGFGTGVLLFRLWANHPVAMPRALFIALAILLPMLLLSPLTAVYWQFMFIIIFSPVLIIAGASHEYPAAQQFFKASADLSYPLYILHWPIYSAIKSFTMFLNKPYDSWQIALLAFFTATILSYVVLKIFDEPLRSWLAAKDRDRKARRERRKFELNAS